MGTLAAQLDTLNHLQVQEVVGSVSTVRGQTILVDDFPAPVGSLVRLQPAGARRRPSPGDARGEVIGFNGAQSIVMLLQQNDGVTPGMHVVCERTDQSVLIGPSMLGRVIDGFGRPIDGGRLFSDAALRPLHRHPAQPLQRSRIVEPLPTGVRAIDGMLTLGKGQRIGIFSGAGVGKSTLLASLARNGSADVNVIGLIGERGREVRDFIEKALEDGLSKSVVVVATGDQSALMRVRATWVACAVAEYFSDQGADVLLMMDSITRFAQAQRQIGLSMGEQPATKGYTPSVFAMLPVMLERAGTFEGKGSITGVYSILVDADDMNEPIADAARGVLDGHIVLSRKLATRGHYPAIDVLESISRVADDVCDQHHQQARQQIIRLLAAYREAEELINIGAYSRGSNIWCDVAIALKQQIDAFLRQERQEKAGYAQTCRALLELAAASQTEKMRLEQGHAPATAKAGREQGGRR